MAAGLDRRRPARHGRLVARARGVPALLRAARGRPAPARARLDRPARGRAPSSGRSTSTRRCSSSRRSRAARSRRCRCSSTSARAGRQRPAHFVADHRPRLVAGSPRSTASAACSTTTRTSAAATARCRTSASSPPRWPGIDVARRCSRARRSPAAVQLRAADPEANSGLWLGAALGELARAGRDKLTFVVDEPLGSFGLWAEQLVAESHGQAGPRHPARSPTSRCVDPEAYGDDRVFVHLRNAEEPDADTTRPSPRSPRPGTRRSPCTLAGPRTSGGSSSSRSSPPRSRAGCSRSTRSTSPTSRRPRTTRSGCSTRAAARPSRTATCRAARRPRAAGLPGDHGLPALRRRESRPPSSSLRAAVIERTASPRPSATGRASCTRRASSTRAARRRAPSSSSSTTRDDGRRRSRARRSTSARSSARRPTATSQTLRVARPRSRARALHAGDLAGAIDDLTDRIRRRVPHADRLRRPREDGRQHGPPHPPGLRAPGASPSTSTTRRVERGRGATARPAPSRSRTSCRKLDAPRAVWIMVPAGDPTQETIDQLAELLERGRPDRRRRQLELARRRGPRRGLERARHPLRRRRHVAAASGASRSATA